jgi:hypothetical protein|tara:strand:- start:94 stop:519 length:426 start_codon:yes stop_codon:yes gene_type:complete
MFDKKYEERLQLWHDFRSQLETSLDPIQDTIEFYKTAPLNSIAADAWTQDSWPNPWELLEENNYCAFVKILAICYTLQLTDVLSQVNYEIHITQDPKTSTTYYLLYVGDRVIGFHGDTHVAKDTLPKSLASELEYSMQPLQ